MTMYLAAPALVAIVGCVLVSEKSDLWGLVVDSANSMAHTNLQSPISIRGPGGGGGLKPSRRCAMWIHSQCKRISTLFSRHFAISSRPTRSLGAFGAKSESPPLSQDLKRLHAPTRDLRLLSSIYTGEDLPPPILQSTAALGRRFATYEISKRHLRSTVQGSSDVAQRCPCMPFTTPRFL